MDRQNNITVSISTFLALGLVVVAITGLTAIALNAAPLLVYAQNSTPSSSSSSSPVISKGSVKGAVTSIQNDMTGKINWIVGGAYKWPILIQQIRYLTLHFI